MFVQVIEGKTNDPEGLHQQLEVWKRDLMPGAIGYLGSTSGCTSNGDCIVIARFESREAAQQNSDRPEQTAWWNETQRLFDGAVTFHDTEDIEIMDHGSLDEAHFVQVMEGHVTDRARATALEHEADPMLREMRPDLLGSMTAYFGDNEYAEVAYFTSEAQAREGEGKAMTADAASNFEEWERVMKVERYLDISDPWLVSGATGTTGTGTSGRY